LTVVVPVAAVEETGDNLIFVITVDAPHMQLTACGP
jgi:hypothetical protein